MRNLESFLNRRKIQNIEAWVKQQNFSSISDLENFCNSQNIHFELSKYSGLFSKNENSESISVVKDVNLQKLENSFVLSEDESEDLGVDLENYSSDESQESVLEIQELDAEEKSPELPDFSRKNPYKKNKKKN